MNNCSQVLLTIITLLIIFVLFLIYQNCQENFMIKNL